MADSTITGMSAASALDGTEKYPLDQGGTTKEATLAQVWTTPVNAQTGTTYTVVDGDRRKIVTLANAAAIAVTLPQAGASSSFIAGWFCYFENTGVGIVTITPTTSTIDGLATLVLTQDQGALIVSDGTNYFTMRGKDSGMVPINAQSASYTLVLADKGKCVEISNASANTLTVPPNSSVAFPINTVILVRQMGAGLTTITQGAGVTVRTPLTLALKGQYATANLHKRATDEWCLDGNIT